MSKTKWTRQTPTFWTATIDGYRVSVKRWRFNKDQCYHVTFYLDADSPWSCGYPETLTEAKRAAEQMAQRWAKRGKA